MSALDRFLERCVFLDLEVHRNGRLGRIGAVRGEAQFQWSGRRKQAGLAALDDLDAFVADLQANCVGGHNLLTHDWPHLQQLRPSLRLLELPVVDTLFLSPLAFPENPYHALVKDYRLVKDSVNDPVSDACLSERVFRDEWQVFAQHAVRGENDLISLLRFCLSAGLQVEERSLCADGLLDFFDQHGAVRLDMAAAQERFERLAAGRVCVASTIGLVSELAASHRLAALAYVTAWLGVAGGVSVLPPWVRLALPETIRLVHRLRAVPCSSPGCA
ncbi:MAG: RecQ family ATP-dependent DNA helicase, partial [Planctomycetes bacterium]|nr:RecQ family ATP-dependent DNA helicase [Planctomycetota bacterium]